jgi:hypothetical protein
MILNDAILPPRPGEDESKKAIPNTDALWMPLYPGCCMGANEHLEDECKAETRHGWGGSSSRWGAAYPELG